VAGADELEEERELLGEQLVVLFDRLAENGERLGEGTAAGDDLGPAVAEEVQCGEVLVDPDRVEHAQHRDRTGEADRSRPGRDSSQYDSGGRDGEVQGVVLTQSEQIEPEIVGQSGVADDLVDALHSAEPLSRCRAGLDVAQRQDPQFHGRHRPAVERRMARARRVGPTGSGSSEAPGARNASSM
jgi:hypothetical protein